MLIVQSEGGSNLKKLKALGKTLLFYFTKRLVLLEFFWHFSFKKFLIIRSSTKPSFIKQIDFSIILMQSLHILSHDNGGEKFIISIKKIS